MLCAANGKDKTPLGELEVHINIHGWATLASVELDQNRASCNHSGRYDRLMLRFLSKRLGMHFLRVLMRELHSVNEELRLHMALIIRDEDGMSRLDTATNWFIKMQELVCVPLLTWWCTWVYMNCGFLVQYTDHRSQEGTRKEGKWGMEVFEVIFQGEHLKMWLSAKPRRHRMVGRWFTGIVSTKRGELARI
jgi:hypothetical protein